MVVKGEYQPYNQRGEGIEKQLAPNDPSCPMYQMGDENGDNDDDDDLNALGDIAMNAVFGPRCVYCPLFIPRCRCPPYFRCVLVKRSCYSCAHWRCVPRIPIPRPRPTSASAILRPTASKRD